MTLFLSNDNVLGIKSKNMAKNLLKPEKITKRFLSVLPERSYDVVSRRFGLENTPVRVTLEAIGRDYGITRERVRQIENNALRNIRKSDIFFAEQQIFDQLKDIVDSLGGIVSEDELLSHLAEDDFTKNHIHFLLVLGDYFNKEKENPHFKTRWYIDGSLASSVHQALGQLHEKIGENDLYPESEIVNILLNYVDEIVDQKYKNEEIAKRWLSLSKAIGKNHFNEWGLSSSSNISAKGIRDYAYLSIRQHGSPMHFTEVAKAIEGNFGKKAHTATCHNELIKDERFVLVGRGLYALKEWGYTAGVVRDVIQAILESEGPLTKEEIVEKVLRERYIKENTVVVNLQDPRYFKKDAKGRYIVA